MAKLKNQNIGEKLLDLQLNKNQINLFLDSIHEKFWDESLKVYKKLNIIRKDLDTPNEIYALLKIQKKSYDVNLEVLDNKFVSFCNCAHREDSKGCQHIGAVLLFKMIKEKDNDFNNLKINSKVIEKKASDLEYFKILFPTLKKKDKQNMIYFNFEDFSKDSPLLKIERGIIKNNGQYGLPVKFHGKKFDSHDWKISKNVKKALNFISGGDTYGMHDSSVGFSKSKFYDANTDLMMPVFRNLFFEEQEIMLGAIFSKEPFEITWEISKENGENYSLEPFFISGKKKTSLLKMDLFEIGSSSLWVFDNIKRTFYGYKNEEDLETIRNIIRFPKKLILTETELKIFFNKYYQKVLDNFELNVSNDLRREQRSIIPKPKIYLEKNGTTVKIKVHFDYAGREVNYFSKNKEVVIIEKDIIYDISRDFEQEEETIEILNELSVVMHDEKDEFIIEGELVDFIDEQIPKILEKEIQVLGEENLFHFKVIKGKTKIDMNIKQQNDWFNLKGTVKFGSQEVDIIKVLETIFENKRFVDLGEDKKAVIPKKWLDSLNNYSGFFDLEKDLKVSKSHIGIIETLIELSTNVKMDAQVKKTINNLKNIKEIEKTLLPKKLNAKLRPYQKLGYDWLYFLRKNSFNGILADDMGLGKTLQTLALLQKIKEEGKSKPFLVIVPTSLVYNWKNEIKKFTPNITTYIHHGQKRVSKNKFNETISKHDLTITTYGTLRNDLEKFKDIEFGYIVLDEAHTIKNPLSISAKSVYTLNSKNKLIISGTPIQNNLTELWSLFNFLNPGYLGGYDFFRETFVVPIEKEHNKNTSESLKKLISPFLMRRTKKIIANELPEKTEMILTSNFSSEERTLYDNWKEYYKHEIKNSVKEKGINQSRMKILEGLTKLRQICLHPKMIDPTYTGESAKFELLILEIEKVISEGHKVLIFSSFVKILKIIEEEFQKRGLRYSYLDGQTKNREEIVSKFQKSEDAQSFLISIKAGGVGLNLTSADYVFIIDPWWNPAVETQAMDRAHRIGQENKVFVYKMIAEDTIEEKILKLQESKKKLVEELIVEESGKIKSMDFKDIEKLFD